MKPTISTDCSDRELNEAVAKACGIPIAPEREYVDYTTSLDAIAVCAASNGQSLSIRQTRYGTWDAKQHGIFNISTPARAACFAFLKAHGVTVTEGKA